MACKRSTNAIAPDPSDRPKKDAAPVDDEVDVWSIVVDDVAAPFADAGAPMAVVDTTMKPFCVFELPASIPTAKTETIDALLKSTTMTKVRPLHTRVAVKLVDENVPVSSPPPGFVALSPVSFDGAHREALVEVMHVQGLGAMRAVVYHLVRDEGSWRKMEIGRCS